MKVNSITNIVTKSKNYEVLTITSLKKVCVYIYIHVYIYKRTFHTRLNRN